jgi:hypothetical protein
MGRNEKKAVIYGAYHVPSTQFFSDASEGLTRHSTAYKSIAVNAIRNPIGQTYQRFLGWLIF